VARSLLIAVAIASSALPAAASDLGAVHCSPNSDRVWVYESLNSFDVETRLKCGETVEILSRVHGFVKVRTASGVEGYVPDSAFPDLPALPDDSEKPAASLASRAVVTAPGHAVAPMPPPPAITPAASNPAAAPAAAPASAKVSTVNSAPAVATQPSPAAKPVALVASKAATAPATEPKAAASPNSVHSTVNVKASSGIVSAAPAKTREKSATPAAVAEPAPPKKAPAKTAAPATTQTAKSIVTAPQPSIAAKVVPAKADMTPGVAGLLPASANASPKADLNMNETDRDPDLEEVPDAKPENESADPACRVFFSAYGLAPAQYKWMVENRKKEFSSICPAPDLAHVDYIVLFAHDSDTFNSSMPALVHTDRNGFSDFSPMTTVDTALQSISDLDKARYEFVWVFHAKRGTFDPAKFSSRRRPLYTNDAKGSHAAGRAVEDAFQFIEGQGSPDR